MMLERQNCIADENKTRANHGQAAGCQGNSRDGDRDIWWLRHRSQGLRAPLGAPCYRSVAASYMQMQSFLLRIELLEGYA